jgi:UDP-2,4-diacetamido-2,4,6-trideoxy-beta-L-altropyranose hydrolase
VLAENQQDVAEAAGKMGIAWSLGRGGGVSAAAIAEKLTELLNASDTRKSQSEKGRKLVDGRGAERVVAFLSGVELRKTLEPDCEMFWEWANEPGARAASFRNKTISWDHHVRWFREKMSDPNAVLYTATTRDGLPMGEVRFQIDGTRAVLSISLAARFRGCGWGQKILVLATEKIFQASKVEFIDAYVKPTNQPSLKLFAGAGFLRLSPVVIEGQEGVHFVLERGATA